MQKLAALGLGWCESLPDFRDFSPQTAEVRAQLERLDADRPTGPRKPSAVDLREFFPEAYDQKGLNSSTAQACVGLVEYFERRARGRCLDPSPAFLYKTTRKLMGVTGDTGANLRTTLKAMVRFGIPPERYWPYDAERFDEEPDGFLYSFTEPYAPISYVRLDARNTSGAETLEMVKSFLAAGFPSLFGFVVPGSISSDGDVPHPPPFDRVCGGQAVVAVGYDERRLRATRGALLIRNSWGTSWGEGGYGWLPFAYVEQQLAVDFWTLLRPDWLESEEFRHPDVLE